jgi:flagellar motor switch protein FliN/FliY
MSTFVSNVKGIVGNVPPRRPPSKAAAEPSQLPPPAGEIHRILSLTVPVSATLAERDMTVGAILAINVGAIVEFDVPVDAELVLYVGNRPIGRGQAIKAGENFGVRITRIDDVEQRIGAMGS